MLLPMRNVTLPAALSGQPNGKLPDSLLVSTPGQNGGPTVRLVAPAARAWKALCAAAKAAGHVLTATSLADSYRSYAVQVATFEDRYTTIPLAGRASKVWQGKTWWQEPGTAVAAVPGTSNHGFGLAVDVADVDLALSWLVANEERFGFSHELSSEPWHIHYFAGDAIPAAVLAYEGGAAAPGGDIMRYQFDGSWKDRPADLADHVIVTDGLGLYFMEPSGLDAEGRPAVQVIARADVRDQTWDFHRAFFELTGGCEFAGKSGVAAWRAPAAGIGSGLTTADVDARIAAATIHPAAG